MDAPIESRESESPQLVIMSKKCDFSPVSNVKNLSLNCMMRHLLSDSSLKYLYKKENIKKR